MTKASDIVGVLRRYLPSLAACLAAAIPAASTAVYITLNEKLSWSRLLLHSAYSGGHDVTLEDALCIEHSRWHDKRKGSRRLHKFNYHLRNGDNTAVYNRVGSLMGDNGPPEANTLPSS